MRNRERVFQSNGHVCSFGWSAGTGGILLAVQVSWRGIVPELVQRRVVMISSLCLVVCTQMRPSRVRRHAHNTTT
jgi:hypothetical protein